jgi:hypothetical protein
MGPAAVSRDLKLAHPLSHPPPHTGFQLFDGGSMHLPFTELVHFRKIYAVLA